MKKAFQKIKYQFMCNSCSVNNEDKGCNTKTGGPKICIGHVGLFLAAVFILISELMR